MSSRDTSPQPGGSRDYYEYSSPSSPSSSSSSSSASTMPSCQCSSTFEDPNCANYPNCRRRALSGYLPESGGFDNASRSDTSDPAFPSTSSGFFSAPYNDPSTPLVLPGQLYRDLFLNNSPSPKTFQAMTILEETSTFYFESEYFDNATSQQAPPPPPPPPPPPQEESSSDDDDDADEDDEVDVDSCDFRNRSPGYPYPCNMTRMVSPGKTLPQTILGADTPEPTVTRMDDSNSDDGNFDEGLEESLRDLLPDTEEDVSMRLLEVFTDTRQALTLANDDVFSVDVDRDEDSDDDARLVIDIDSFSLPSM
ncbi:Protein of unknown function [Gryllus bimaculatus]|nr:Protein of unknown function [Gryllus bimaculatus]